MVKARLKEAMRLARQFSKKTLVYIRYVYSDTKKPLSEVMKFISSKANTSTLIIHFRFFLSHVPSYATMTECFNHGLSKCEEPRH